ncbi:MAG: energy transducer TonB [Deltaproteobacteria bacterium]|jgi:protein TonB|nr:energy transducer TonB [Deltaproteobacteria bacterium]
MQGEPSLKNVFLESLALSLALHLAALGLIVRPGPPAPPEQWSRLAAVDFSLFDPDGGSPGLDDPRDPPAAAAESPAGTDEPVPPEPEPEEVPEPPPGVLESSSPEAAPLVLPEPVPAPAAEKPPRRPPERREAPPAARPGARAGPASPGPGAGGSGDGVGRGNPDRLEAYKALVSQILNRFKKYPYEAVSRGLGGTAEVSFTIGSSGRGTGARIVSSSGHGVLDEEVLALVRRCSPFPPIPPELNLEKLNLTVPVTFRLN